MIWPLDKGAEILKFWQELMLQEPDELYGFFAFLTVPPGAPFPEAFHRQKMCGVVWCYTGPLEEAEAAFNPIRQFAPPAIDFAGPIAYPALQTMFDPLYPPGLQWYWRADYFQHYDDKAIELAIKYGSRLPSLLTGSHIYPINGAAGRVGRSDTAWSYRDANFVQVFAGVDPDPANYEHLRAWAKDFWLALHPYAMGGGYVNMIMDEGQDHVEAAYRDNYMRLAQVKAKYDPHNFFHVNQNIKPAD